MSRSRGQRIKAISGKANDPRDYDVFYMSLAEAKELIAGEYEFLAERYERRRPRNKLKPSQG